MRDGRTLFWTTLAVGLLVVVLAALVHAQDMYSQQNQLWTGSAATGHYFSSSGGHIQTFDQGLGSSTFFYTDPQGHQSSGTIFYQPAYLPPPPTPNYGTPAALPGFLRASPPTESYYGSRQEQLDMLTNAYERRRR